LFARLLSLVIACNKLKLKRSEGGEMGRSQEASGIVGVDDEDEHKVMLYECLINDKNLIRLTDKQQQLKSSIKFMPT